MLQLVGVHHGRVKHARRLAALRHDLVRVDLGVLQHHGAPVVELGRQGLDLLLQRDGQQLWKGIPGVQWFNSQTA